MIESYDLPFLPERPQKPRESGLTMVMDKGLSHREAENMIFAAGHLIDFVKLGFGTMLVTNNVIDKVRFYQRAGIKVYPGGTLFEAFVIRNRFDEYLRLLDDMSIDTCEISDGSMIMNHDVKCDYIKKLSENFLVLSEVGSKDASVVLSDEQWITGMKKELDAGSWKVIAEARESGTVGIYDNNGNANESLIQKIQDEISTNNIIWEAPLKPQQVWFIKNFGQNVNLGNIATFDVISLETLRLGLRGDTFSHFMPDELK